LDKEKDDGDGEYDDYDSKKRKPRKGKAKEDSPLPAKSVAIKEGSFRQGVMVLCDLYI
jgi:hypothetical protein